VLTTTNVINQTWWPIWSAEWLDWGSFYFTRFMGFMVLYSGYNVLEDYRISPSSHHCSVLYKTSYFSFRFIHIMNESSYWKNKQQF
jgi:hypothetical protein